MLRDFSYDVRYAIRTFVKTPSFTVAAIVTLAVGIGTTVGTCTVVNAVLVRPLPSERRRTWWSSTRKA
jgi:hypothetical protein